MALDLLKDRVNEDGLAASDVAEEVGERRRTASARRRRAVEELRGDRGEIGARSGGDRGGRGRSARDQARSMRDWGGRREIGRGRHEIGRDRREIGRARGGDRGEEREGWLVGGSSRRWDGGGYLCEDGEVVRMVATSKVERLPEGGRAFRAAGVEKLRVSFGARVGEIAGGRCELAGGRCELAGGRCELAGGGSVREASTFGAQVGGRLLRR